VLQPPSPAAIPRSDSPRGRGFERVFQHTPRQHHWHGCWPSHSDSLKVAVGRVGRRIEILRDELLLAIAWGTGAKRSQQPADVCSNGNEEQGGDSYDLREIEKIVARSDLGRHDFESSEVMIVERIAQPFNGRSTPFEQGTSEQCGTNPHCSWHYKTSYSHQEGGSQ
jgi:hypothetical protein